MDAGRTSTAALTAQVVTLAALVAHLTAAIVGLTASIDGLRQDLRESRAKEHWHDG
jgi:hypothetical protein